jgi:undecaprenyl-diphosphatase
MAAAGGTRGRRAALRGSTCYLLGAAVGNGLKPLFGRPQPRHRLRRRPQVVRGSFPSGHGAAEVAYTFGAAQEAPIAFVPFAAMALLAHWSLVRSSKHYVADMLVGGTLGLILVGLVAMVWPASED